MPDPAVPVAAPDVVELKSVESSLKLQGYYAHASTVMKAAAEITRLREELAAVTLHLRTAEEAADHSPFSSLSLACTITALRARVAELEAILVELAELKIHKDAFGKTEDYQRRQPLAWKRVRQVVNAAVTPTRDPRDARIAELEAALREVRQWLYGESPPNFDREWRELQGICDRALGDDHG